jgi:hypothetical protein
LKPALGAAFKAANERKINDVLSQKGRLLAFWSELRAVQEHVDVAGYKVKILRTI